MTCYHSGRQHGGEQICLFHKYIILFYVCTLKQTLPFTDSDYKDSSALVITFLVNNHNEDKLNGKAEAWEKEFINFIKKYKNNNMTIAFSSEVFASSCLDFGYSVFDCYIYRYSSLRKTVYCFVLLNLVAVCSFQFVFVMYVCVLILLNRQFLFILTLSYDLFCLFPYSNI